MAIKKSTVDLCTINNMPYALYSENTSFYVAFHQKIYTCADFTAIVCHCAPCHTNYASGHADFLIVDVLIFNYPRVFTSNAKSNFFIYSLNIVINSFKVEKYLSALSSNCVYITISQVISQFPPQYIVNNRVLINWVLSLRTELSNLWDLSSSLCFSFVAWHDC